jgi:hypothetical protein
MKQRLIRLGLLACALGAAIATTAPASIPH